MNNYFQKITSRSDKQHSNQAVLSLQPLAVYQPADHTATEQDANMDAGTNDLSDVEVPRLSSKPSMENLSLKNSPLLPGQQILPAMQPAAQQQYIVQKPKIAVMGTAEESEMANSNDKQGLHKEFIRKDGIVDKKAQLLQPNPTIIEKITQRSVNNTVVVNQGAKPQMITTTGGNAALLKPLPVPHEKVQPVKVDLEKENDQENKSTNVNQWVYPDQVQKRKESLLPVQQETMPVAKQVKPKQDNRLVIGRITVEVINSVQAAAKSKEPVRQNTTNKISASNTSGINKFSFGLGQL